MSTKLRLGIRGKFVLLTAAILSVVFVAIAFYLAQSNTSSLRKSLYEQVQSFATLATTPIGDTFVLYKDSGTINIDRVVGEFSKLNKAIMNITVVGLDGSALYTQFRNSPTNITPLQAESFEPIYLYDKKDVLETVIFPYKESNGVRRYSIVYSVSGTSIDESVAQATTSVVLLSLAGLIITSVLLYFFVNYWLIRKVRLISHQSILISQGQLDQVVATNSTDELGELARSVNTMAVSLKANIEKLQDLDKAKSEFMMIASHSIRTPLTIINGFIDSSEDYNTVEQLRGALEKIEAGSKRLSVFAEDVLTISRLELGEQIKALEPVNVTEFLSAVSKDFLQLAELKQVEFKDNLPPITRKILINRPYMRAAVWNLLDNALKFTAKGGKIELTAVEIGDNVEISVKDTGIGISDDEILKLFTKFHRGTDTLTYDYEGTGIGLYATKMIIDRMQGNITAKSTIDVGSCFTITLPFTTKKELLSNNTPKG